MAIEDFYTDTILIKRPVSTLSDGGKMETDYTDINTIPGLLEDIGGDQYYKNERRTYITTHIVYTHFSADIKDNDILEISGKDYKVHNVENPIPKNHHLEISVERIK